MLKRLLSRALVIFMLFLISCSDNKTSAAEERKDGFSNKPQTKEDSLVKEVLEGHDIGMAQNLKITKYLRLTKESLDSLGKLSSKKLDKGYQQALIDLQEDLNYADFSMTKWMEEFKLDSLKGDLQKRLTYLEAEKIKVNAVKEIILSSVAKGDSLLRGKN